MSIYPDLYRGTSKPLAPGWLTSPVVRRATAMHSVILPYPKSAATSGRRSPEEVPCSLLRLPASWSPDQAPEIIVDPFRSKLDG